MGLRRVPVDQPVAVVRFEPLTDAAGPEILRRPGLPFRLLAHGGFHVDAGLDRTRLA
jgi:hypothetical protein